jgi:hypothetical protein
LKFAHFYNQTFIMYSCHDNTMVETLLNQNKNLCVQTPSFCWNSTKLFVLDYKPSNLNVKPETCKVVLQNGVYCSTLTTLTQLCQIIYYFWNFRFNKQNIPEYSIKFHKILVIEIFVLWILIISENNTIVSQLPKVHCAT